MSVQGFCALGRGTYLGQGCSGARALGGHGEHSGDAQAHAGWRGIHVDPEGNPGQDDNEQAGNVHLDQVVAHLSLQVEPGLYAGEFTCKKLQLRRQRCRADRDRAPRSERLRQQSWVSFTPAVSLGKCLSVSVSCLW